MKSISKTLLVLAMDDEHEMKFRITRKTKFIVKDKQGSREIKPETLEAGQPLAVDAQTTLDGAFEAVQVVAEAAGIP